MDIQIFIHCDIDSIVLLNYLFNLNLGTYHIVFYNKNEELLFYKKYKSILPKCNYIICNQEQYPNIIADYTICCCNIYNDIRSSYIINKKNDVNVELYNKTINKLNEDIIKYIYFDMFNEITGFKILVSDNYNNYMEYIYKYSYDIFNLLRPADYINFHRKEYLIIECNSFIKNYNIKLNSKGYYYLYKWRHIIDILFPSMKEIYLYEDVFSTLYSKKYKNVIYEWNKFYLSTIIHREQFNDLILPFKNIYNGHILNCMIKKKEIKNYEKEINDVLVT